MTTDTEALRAAFEDYINPEGDVALHWQPAGYYAGGGLQGSWLDFQSGYQAGHAAAKAETAAPVVGRWYFVTNDGAATLCVDEADARESAAEADIAFPRMAPHRAVQLVSASQLAAAVAAERERVAQICDRRQAELLALVPGARRSNVVRMHEACANTAAVLAQAIRAGAKEPSDG